MLYPLGKASRKGIGKNLRKAGWWPRGLSQLKERWPGGGRAGPTMSHECHVKKRPECPPGPGATPRVLGKLAWAAGLLPQPMGHQQHGVWPLSQEDLTAEVSEGQFPVLAPLTDLAPGTFSPVVKE